MAVNAIGSAYYNYSSSRGSDSTYAVKSVENIDGSNGGQHSSSESSTGQRTNRNSEVYSSAGAAGELLQLSTASNYSLPSTQDAMNQMRGFSPPPNIRDVSMTEDAAEAGVTSGTGLEVSLKQYIEAYTLQSKNLFTETAGTTVAFEV